MANPDRPPGPQDSSTGKGPDRQDHHPIDQGTPSPVSGNTPMSLPSSASLSRLAPFDATRPRAPSLALPTPSRAPVGNLPASSSLPRLPSANAQTPRSRAPTMSSQASGGSSPRILPNSPSLGRGSPLARRPSSSHSGPPNVPTGPASSTSNIVFKTFRVVRPLSAADANSLNRQGRGFVRLEVGDFGVVPNIAENVVDNNLVPYPIVQLLRHGPGRIEPRPGMPFENGKCRVPKVNIEIGVTRKDDVKLVNETDVANPTLKLQLSQNTTALQKFLESFLASMSDDETQKSLKQHGVPEVAADVVQKPDKCRMFVKEFLTGMHYCGTFDLLKDGMPKLDEIWTKARYVDSEASSQFFTKDGTYYYLIIYRNEKTGDIAIYIGRTYHLLNRYRQHSEGLSSDSPTLHYQMGRAKIKAGATYRLFPITHLPKNLSNFNVFRSWAETVLIVLFDSFNPIMLFKGKSSSGVASDELPQWGRSVERDTFLQTATSPAANLLQSVADRIKGSNTPLSQFKLKDPSMGFNWSVPLIEGIVREANLWVRTTTQGDANKPAVWTFRTHPRRLTKGRRLGIFNGRVGGTQPVKFRPVIPLEGTPLGPGSVVNVVIEITVDSGARHPSPYVQLPKCGPYDCWDEAFRLAIRIEYEDAGQWKTKYIKQDSFTTFAAKIKTMKPDDFGQELNHLELSWLHAMKMLAALLNWRWQPEDNVLVKKVWVPYSNRLRIIDFDFFNQRLLVGDCPPVNKPQPRPLTLDETARMIREKFGNDIHIGTLPSLALVNVSGMIRTKCDLCAAAGKDMRLARRCEAEKKVINTVNGVDIVQCPFSAALGRYCTFTMNIQDRHDLHDLMYHSGQGGYPVQSTTTPPNVFQYLEVREKMKEEPVEEDGGDD